MLNETCTENAPTIAPACGQMSNPAVAEARWYVLWTQSHCERFVQEQLATKGFRPFLPMTEVWSRRRGIRRLVPTPLFPGYLFLHQAMDHKSYVTVLETRGVVGILGEGWDRLAVVPDEEIETIQTVIHRRVPVLPYPYSHVREGQRVRIIGGPLADVEGVLVKSKPDRGLLVLSIRLLQRSVAVEIDYSLVAAA